jgi:type II secretory pathway component PulK
LAILSVLAIGLGRAARIDLALVKHRVGKIRADGLIWAAMHYAQNQVRLDKEKTIDTVYQCGFSLQDNKTPQDIFSQVRLQDGSFDISYLLDAGEGQKDVCYGLQDEERRININGIHKQNNRILVHFFMLVGLPEQQAQALVDEIVSWHDGDEKKNSQFSPTSDGYKAIAFENIEELLLLKGMTQDIFKKVKDSLTVFPLSGAMGININTASEIVLKSLFRFFAENNKYDIRKADSLARKIIFYRKGSDGRLCTQDDLPVEKTGISELDPEEGFIYANSMNNLVWASRYFRIKAKGVESQYNVSSELETIMDQDNNRLVFWKRK